MKTLSANWFAEGTLDLEYKQYVLLAYLQAMRQELDHTRLYPPLADLIFHYRNLVAYRDQKAQLSTQFPHDLTAVDLAQLRLVYTPTIQEDDALAEIDELVAYAIPRIQSEVEAGREIYDLVDEQLQLQPVGVLPLYQHEGYLLIRRGTRADVAAYQYHILPIEQGPDRAHAIRTHYVASFPYTLTNTYESMKRELIRQQAELPNPATYAVESGWEVPLAETLLPITKRRLLRTVA